jgi:hypothetical protein
MQLLRIGFQAVSAGPKSKNQIAVNVDNVLF